jgi:putative lipoprotein
MKYLLSILFALSNTAWADSWVGRDKQLHFAGSVVIAGVTTAITKDETTGFIVATGIGIAKEIYDSKHRAGDASYKDLAWDIAGAWVGSKLGGIIITKVGDTTKISYRIPF